MTADRFTGGDPDLRADCARCAALCCVATEFTTSADFATDKPPGQPCPNLLADFRCGIHDNLRERGFAGCAVFDCFGAGQHVTQVTFGGRDWRRSPQIAPEMFAVFPVVRRLKETLWYLAEALTIVEDGSLRDDLRLARERTERLTTAAPEELTSFDADGHRREIGSLLARVSETVRAGVRSAAPDHTNADLIGAKLRGADLRGASLRGAYLLGADLRGADLRMADLLGVDLRAADVRGARLGESIFLTQPQLDATRGDAATTVPVSLRRPRHWSSSSRTARGGVRLRTRRRQGRR